MDAVLAIAGREVRHGMRNRWVVATTALLAALALALAFLGSAPTGTVGVGRLSVTIVSLSSLTIFLVPLIALMVSYDAVVGEMERGTMLLVLTYPVRRWQVLAGKFLGHTAILAFATVVGYGLAGVVVGLTDDGGGSESWRAFAAMVASSVMLGAAFVAIGYMVSVSVRERGTAAGLAVAVWLGFVLLYDMVLLGVLVMDHGQTIRAAWFNVLLLFNPADAYRVFNLTGFAEVGRFSGMAAISGNAAMAPGVLLGVMVAWIAVPLALAGLIFQRREL